MLVFIWLLVVLDDPERNFPAMEIDQGAGFRSFGVFFFFFFGFLNFFCQFSNFFHFFTCFSIFFTVFIYSQFLMDIFFLFFSCFFHFLSTFSKLFSSSRSIRFRDFFFLLMAQGLGHRFLRRCEMPIQKTRHDWFGGWFFLDLFAWRNSGDSRKTKKVNLFQPPKAMFALRKSEKKENTLLVWLGKKPAASAKRCQQMAKVEPMWSLRCWSRSSLGILG